MITSQSRGVRKLSERNLQQKRALILTEEDAQKLDWSEVPVGTLKVNPTTGMLSVKLQDVLILKENNKQLENHLIVQQGANSDPEDPVVRIVDRTVADFPTHGTEPTTYKRKDIFLSSQTDWLPAGIKNDGTISIAKDEILVEETFLIVDPNPDIQHTYTYKNYKGELRHMPVTDEGYLVFELELGSYLKHRNHLSVNIDDVLERTASSGGLVELTENRFALTEKLVSGQEITARYYSAVRIGNPYPRVFESSDEPTKAEEGDLWIEDKPVEEIDDNHLDTGEEMPPWGPIDWKWITGKPQSLKGYGIVDNVEYKNHTHYVTDIVDFPSTMPANGGNADTVKGHTVGENPGNIPLIDQDGKIARSLVPELNLTIESISGFSIGTQAPASPKENDIWFDINEKIIKFRKGSSWESFGATWLG